MVLPAEAATFEACTLTALCLQALAKMDDVVICRCGTACLEDKDHMVQCPKCFFVFCAICRDAWHPGKEVSSWPALMVAQPEQSSACYCCSCYRCCCSLHTLAQQGELKTVAGRRLKLWCTQCLSVEMKLRYLRERKQATGAGDARQFIRMEQDLMSQAHIKASTLTACLPALCWHSQC